MQCRKPALSTWDVFEVYQIPAVDTTLPMMHHETTMNSMEHDLTTAGMEMHHEPWDHYTNSPIMDMMHHETTMGMANPKTEMMMHAFTTAEAATSTTTTSTTTATTTTATTTTRTTTTTTTTTETTKTASITTTSTTTISTTTTTQGKSRLQTVLLIIYNRILKYFIYLRVLVCVVRLESLFNKMWIWCSKPSANLLKWGCRKPRSSL